MIQLIDRIDCDGLQRSIVKPEAFKKAVLVQDAGNKDDLFALLMVDDRRAALVAQGAMSLNAVAGGAMLRLQTFRNQLDRADVRIKELRFCTAGIYAAKAGAADHFENDWFVQPTFPDLVERFAAWRAGRATW
jgi:hypothetical protein